MHVPAKEGKKRNLATKTKRKKQKMQACMCRCENGTCLYNSLLKGVYKYKMLQRKKEKKITCNREVAQE
jgi:hypothetical protein